MWDLGMSPSLTTIAVDDPEMLHLLTLVFGGIVGIAAALVVLEVLWFHWFRSHDSGVSRTPYTKKEKYDNRPY